MYTMWLARVNDGIKEEIEIVYCKTVDSFQVFYYEEGQRVHRDNYTNFKGFLTDRFKEGFDMEDFQKGGEFEE